MKKFLIGMLIGLSMFSGTAYAQATPQAISMVNTNYSSRVDPASYNLIVDGVNKTSEVTFKVQNNRSMIGLRQFSTVLGATVDWDVEKVATVKKGSTTIEVPIGSQHILVNNNKVAIDNQQTVSIIVDESTYLPYRVIAESLGYTVTYDNNSKTITCTSSTTQQQPQQSIEAGYWDESTIPGGVPAGYEDTTWGYMYIALKYSFPNLTDAQIRDIISQCKLAPKDGNTTDKMTKAQLEHYYSVTDSKEMKILLREGHNKLINVKGNYRGEFKYGYIWNGQDWSMADGIIAGLWGLSR